MSISPSKSIIEQRFLEELRHHLNGWREKIENDFSEQNYYSELDQLKSDPVYSKFGLAIPEYVLVRLMGRISISIGRRLGEIYDKIPRILAGVRYNLNREDVVLKFGRLELDIGIKRELLNKNDDEHLLQVVSARINDFDDSFAGLGIEIRYNFNPNDSSRLRKDVTMAEKLQERNLFPVYLIFSEISPRQEAIERLTRAGWSFLIGSEAEVFMLELIGMNFAEILDQPKIKAEIDMEIRSMMDTLLSSPAFQNGGRLT